MYYKCICQTNIDECRKAIWPDKFVAIPRIGDSVCSADRNSYDRISLKVVGITHTLDDKGIPYVILDLHRFK